MLKLKVGIYANLKLKADYLKERERQLRVSEELLAAARNLSALFDRPEIGMLIADTHGNVRQMNDQVLQIFNCKTQDAWTENGRFISDQLTPLMAATDDRERYRQELLAIRCGDGSETSVVCLVSMLRETDSTAASVAVVIYDGATGR